ncbi:hypothetical protein [Yokenella regensburgei]|uniref:5-bromo-4-chloroindolyl phosphate hydrolysis protein n=1 Tax=Yokenella regensburgei TaxID=158877 RepID=A0AB38FR39_9ENTR|nr:hypothetical protein [Yokenella regensburgei]KFD19196.1 putative exported protein [Yokenella regensburgei ATCC 49455]MDQ4431652.1 hypothetical protein [Yokenella regensburgei]SQA60231.1 Uncharacterised protein [Yokenella regensburgei]SQA67723.1 Uncharacterised protein [Yokenella regensburgei]SUQ06036.1 Uncharacterised protein [Yokenella regensburgei]
MELKYWNRGLLGLTVAILSLTGLVLLKVLVTGEKEIEWGSISDWVSAVCNIGLLCAAFWAGSITNNWLKQKKRMNTLDSAHQIAIQFDKKLWSINHRLYADVLFRKKLINDIINKSSNVDVNEKIISEIAKITTSDLDELSEIYNERTLLGRFNVTVNDSFNKVIMEILSLRSDYLNSHYEYLLLLAKDIDFIECDEVKKAESQVVELQKKIATIFEKKLGIRNIDCDYSFGKDVT